MMKGLLVLCLASCSAFAAGPFSVGIKAGVPLTDFFNTIDQAPSFTLTSSTHRYIVGPTAELKLPLGFSFEVDALYRRFNYNTNFSLADVFTNNRTTGNAWEFPLLAKYRFANPLIKPYVSAGVAFDTLSGIKQTTSILSGRPATSSTSNPAELQNSNTTGFVIGAGLDIHAIVLHISPEIRYTRWGSAHFSIPNVSTLSNQNQAEFLVGFTF
jgi:opacity protein-like surface antigen